MNFKSKLFFLGIFALLFSCARVGSPEGGPKDETPPVVLLSSPDSMATNVSTGLKELRIDFDEYVKLEKPMQQLIISPPIKGITKIIPSNLANKYVLIRWSDTLKENTTYNFNFGNSIVDNNEGNILPYYNLVFSTGPTVDSLYVTGYVDDVLEPRKKKESTVSNSESEPVVVGLYQSSTKKFTEKPYYIAPVDADGYFELNYLAAGDYNLIAFQDENKNSIYDSGKEKVAFLSQALKVTQDTTGLRLLLSPPKKKFKLLETQQIAGGLMMLFQGRPNTDSLGLAQVGDTLKSFTITQKPKSDTAYVWINPQGNGFDESSNRLRFSYYNFTKKKRDTTSIFYKPNAKDQLTLSNASGGVLPPKSTLVLKANMQLDSLDTSRWKLSVDSITPVPFKAEISKSNPFQIAVHSEFLEGQKFHLTIPKESVRSFYFKNPKTILFNFTTGKAKDYGSLVINLKNAPKAPYWIQLVDDKYAVIVQKKVKDTAKITFDNLKPNSYYVRVLVDNNHNGMWDGADFEHKIQPEDAYLWMKQLVVRPSWVINETWDVLDKSPVNQEENQSLLPIRNNIQKIDLSPDKKKDEEQNQEEQNLLNQQRDGLNFEVPRRSREGFQQNR